MCQPFASNFNYNEKSFERLDQKKPYNIADGYKNNTFVHLVPYNVPKLTSSINPNSRLQISIDRVFSQNSCFLSQCQAGTVEAGAYKAVGSS